ncbi:MAG: sodium transport system permease protein [Crocinitomicaceae bacterium]|jgi:sodium transport system permease protein
MIFTIFKKELKDTLRDKRTLIMMLVIPILIFPIILNVFVGISSSFSEEAAKKTVKIGVVGNKDNYVVNQLEALPNEMGKKELVFYKDTLEMIKAIELDSIQIGMYFVSDFPKYMEAKSPAPVAVYFNATDMGMKDRAELYMSTIEGIATQERYIAMDLVESELRPLETSYNNIASNKEMIGKLAGGILPYIFIAFGFIGCMYPAIDLFTGEKERGTIETLLTTPVLRWQILFGKMGVVVLSGLLAASCALLGLFLSIEVLDIVDNQELLDVIHSILNFKFILLLYALLLPLTVFFAGVMIPIAVYAKSFKEAQSIITPLNIVMVLPAMVGFFPGVELNATTASIPVVNVVLATKELIAGTLDIGLLLLSFSVMIGLAVIAVIISYKRFDKETNVIM